MVSIDNQGHEWKQSGWKMLGNELFIYIMTRRPVLPQQEDGNKVVTCGMLPSAVPPGRWRYPKRGITDNRQQPCWRFMENDAFEDEMRIWHSLFIIQCRTLNQILDSISLGVIVPVHLFWSFSPSLHYLFCFSWNETQTKPACHSNSWVTGPLHGFEQATSSLAISLVLSEKQGNELHFADNEKVNMNGIVPRK